MTGTDSTGDRGVLDQDAEPPAAPEVVDDEDLTVPNSLESIEGSPASPDPEDPGDQGDPAEAEGTR
ncbi:hypothetical protein [Microbacterium terricola]|uniref:Sugar ABC transporter ATPase n=1 Tax=Microbacterium terricola TaxID=344163 RepID=A0ABM8E1B3_9MICO|nr:hypothetical protein [Microbacterium terricola]UYK40531.1 hypothetical protein OAU46_02425 [Microbacterium terricola]BDV31744.1 hypothetical protein Microterr_24040 [Microbacterium terricola]